MNVKKGKVRWILLQESLLRWKTFVLFSTMTRGQCEGIKVRQGRQREVTKTEIYAARPRARAQTIAYQKRMVVLENN